MTIERLTTPWWALRAGLGAAAFLAGLDKFFNLLADWPSYLSPVVANILPLSPTVFMHAIGGVEMLAGVAVRDVAMAIAAFTLARLTEAGVGAEARDRAPSTSLLARHEKAVARCTAPHVAARRALPARWHRERRGLFV
jgi:hypothetical protein